MKRIGNAASKLLLHSHLKIHRVFHVSQLKLQEQVFELPSLCLGLNQKDLVSSDVVDKRYDPSGRLDLLVLGKTDLPFEISWMPYHQFIEQFASYKLKDKFGFVGGSIDRNKITYYQKGRGRK